ncbi:intron Large complex component GCFC2 [Rhynchocyon petersi]
MAQRPRRTFRQRRNESSESDSDPATSVEPSAPRDQNPAEEGLPAQTAKGPLRRRRPRRLVWASSRRAIAAASCIENDSGDTGSGEGIVRNGSARKGAWGTSGLLCGAAATFGTRWWIRTARLWGGGAAPRRISAFGVDEPKGKAAVLVRPRAPDRASCSRRSCGRWQPAGRTGAGSADSENALLESRAAADLSSDEEHGPGHSSGVRIPDAAFIEAARRERALARVQDGYLSLDVKQTSTVSQTQSSDEDDPESEPNHHKERIPFTAQPQILRQRMAAEAAIGEETSEESLEDEDADVWEQQQMKKAGKIVEGISIDLVRSIESPKLKKFDTSISFPPVRLESIKRQLNSRLTLLQDTHRSHQREYENCVQAIRKSESAVQELESASHHASDHRFYKSMKVYVGNVINCLNEKIVSILEAESAIRTLLSRQAAASMTRRQDEVRRESACLQQLSQQGKAEVLTNGGLAVDEKTRRILEELESQRARRRQERVLAGHCAHEEGASSDDELPAAEVTRSHRSWDDILQDHKKIFEDVHDDFCNVQSILLKFHQWRVKFPDSYYEAYTSLCIPKLLNPLIRSQLVGWNPLKLDSVSVKQMSWFTSVEEFVDGSVEDPRRKDSCDQKVLSGVINKTVIPVLTDFVDVIWDPLSTSQTTSLITHCRVILEDHLTSENEGLCEAIVSRMKKAIEDDVFIPLYPESVVENKTSFHSKFHERQFRSSLKLFRNVLLWCGLLPDEALQDLGLGKLLNRYLVTALLNATPGLEVVRKCSEVAACLPEQWFEDPAMRTSLPQLQNFVQLLLQFAQKLARAGSRDEVKEVILILVKIKALDQAESFREEHYLDHPASLTE